MTTINASSGPPPADTPTCTPCGTLVITTADGYKCLNCKAEFRRKAPPNLAMDATTGQRFRAIIGQVDPADVSADAWHREYEHLREVIRQNNRRLARALGMAAEESLDALMDRAAEEHKELVTLRPAIAAFRACYEGLPSHVRTRPVCAVSQCENLPKKDGLCNRCYEQKEGR